MGESELNRDDPGQAAGAVEGPADAQVVANQVKAQIDALAAWPDPAGFQQLLTLSEYLGVAIGESARTVAQQGSWGQVAGYASTSKQAAWSRWH